MTCSMYLCAQSFKRKMHFSEWSSKFCATLLYNFMSPEICIFKNRSETLKSECKYLRRKRPSVFKKAHRGQNPERAMAYSDKYRFFYCGIAKVRRIVDVELSCFKLLRKADCAVFWVSTSYWMELFLQLVDNPKWRKLGRRRNHGFSQYAFPVPWKRGTTSSHKFKRSLKNITAFFFARHPYSRTVSSYYDKVRTSEAQ